MYSPLIDVTLLADDEIRPFIFRQTMHPALSNLQLVYPLRTGDFREHRHNNYELILPETGVYRCALDGAELSVRTGEFLLIEQGRIHKDHFEPGANFRCAHFELRDEQESAQVERIFIPELPTADLVSAVPDDDFFRSLLALLFQPVSPNRPWGVRNGLFDALLHLLLTTFPGKFFLRNPNEWNEPNRRRIQLAQAFEAALADGVFDAAAVGRKLGMSPRSFVTFCHKEFSAPPQRAFRQFRIKRVCRYLLEHPDVSVKTVAERFHFANPFHLSRLFSRYIQIPPSQINRISAKNQEGKDIR